MDDVFAAELGQHAKEEDSCPYCIVEVQGKTITVVKGSEKVQHTFRNAYISVQTNDYLLKSQALIAQASNASLYLLRTAGPREDLLALDVRAFAILHAYVVFVEGSYVHSIDLRNGSKKTLIESEEKIDAQCLLLAQNKLVAVEKKSIHVLCTQTNKYTKVKVKVEIDKAAVPSDHHLNPGAPSSDPLLAFTCVDGNVYVFDLQKMSVVKSMKGFGSRATNLGFSQTASFLLYLVTEAGQLAEIDYSSNKIHYRQGPGSSVTSSAPTGTGSVLFSTSTHAYEFNRDSEECQAIYKGKGGSITVIPLPRPQKSPGKRHPIPETGSQKSEAPNPERQTNENAPEKSGSEDPAADLSRSSAASATPHSSLSPRVPPHPSSFPDLSPGDHEESIYSAFNTFKDSVYELQREILSEIFQLKRKIEEMEKRIHKACGG